MDKELIYGIWEMDHLESWHDGELTSDQANAGMFVFTRDNRLSVVSGSNNSVMSYCGRFKIEGDTLIIHTEACNVREREGSDMTRKILKLDREWLALEASNPDIGMRAVITWKRKLVL